MKKLLAYLKDRNVVKPLIVICCAIVFYLVLNNFSVIWGAVTRLFAVLSPFLGGVLMAYLMDPFARFLERKPLGKIKQRKAARGIAVVAAFLIVISLVVLLIITMVPQLVNSCGMLIENIRYYFNNAEETINAIIARFPQLNISVEGVMDTVQTWMEQLLSLLADNLGNILETSYKAGSKIFTFIISIIMSLYIMMDKDNIFASIRRWSKSVMTIEKYERIHFLVFRADRIFTKYLGGNVVDSIIIGVANFVFMAICGMPYALLISVIVGVTNFIPTFGPIIGAVPSALILVLIEPWSALWFLVFTVIIQTLDAYVIKPLLFGDATGLRPLWVMVAVIVGGRLAGAWGMVFGIPLLAVISQLLSESVARRLETRGLDENGVPKVPESSPANGDEK